MESYPKISIVTPSYNQGQFLEETIRGVKNQGYTNFEHIVIDGGSTDNTLETLKKYPHLTWVSEPDRGQTHAINKGLHRATGDILAYINSDDTYLPGAFHTVVAFFQRNPEFDMVYGDYNVIDATGHILKRARQIDFDYGMGCCIGFGIIISQPAAFWRRKVLENVGFLNEQFDYAMDAEYWFRIAQQHNIQHIPASLANFRWHSEAKTTIHRKSSTPKYAQETDKVIEMAYSTLGISKILPFQYSTVFRKVYRLKRVILKFVYGKYNFLARK